MQENKNIEFILKGFKTEQFATFEEFLNIKEEAQVITSTQIKVDKLNYQLGIFMQYEFKQHENIIMKLLISSHFGIKQDTWIGFQQDNLLILPKEFITHLLIVTTGTARGVLVAKTEHSVFSKYMLPLLDITKMINEDVILVVE